MNAREHHDRRGVVRWGSAMLVAVAIAVVAIDIGN
jgi:hypothetical protein